MSDDERYGQGESDRRRNQFYRDNGNLELDDINLQEINDSSEIDDRYKKKSAVTVPNRGKPSKINNYMNQMSDNIRDRYKKQSSVPSDRYGDKNFKTPGRSETDEELIESPNNRGAAESDLKAAMKDMNEMAQVHDELTIFEKNFSNGKKKINNCDILTLEADLSSKSLNMQYEIVHDLLAEDEPDFDQNKMDSKISKITAKVKQNNHEYERYKGEFLAVNEPVINKDINLIKLDMIQKQRDKQEKLLLKLPDQEVQINENAQKIDTLKNDFDQFERGLFEKKFNEVQSIIVDIVKTMDKIQTKQEGVEDLIESAKNDLSFVIPQTKEQRKKLDSINNEIAQIDKRLVKSQNKFDKYCDEKQSLDIKHDICQKILKSIEPKDDVIVQIAQTRKLQTFVDHFKDQQALYKKLKNLLDEDVQVQEFDLQKVLQDGKKLIDGVKQGRKDEYDDLIQKIKKATKKINDNLQYEEGRLKSFENNIMKPNDKGKIPDGELLFLNKEISRNKAAINASKTLTNEVLDDSLQVVPDPSGIEVEDIQQLKQNLKTLEKQETVNCPRIKANIDQLEAFTLQSLKNQLNEENKKSQHQISQMKKNFEDLQKIIDNLNQKINKTGGEINQLKQMFQNDDLERENEIFNRLESELDECDKDTNGDKKQSELLDKSMLGYKKAVIQQINKIVNQFNENNKLIKDSNKREATESDILELLNKNKAVQDNCQKVEGQIKDAKELSVDIEKRLNSLMDPVIGEIKEKYDSKNQSIDECDELFDKANAQIDRLGNDLIGHIEKTQDIIKKLNAANPINNPVGSGKQGQDFLNQVSQKLEESHDHLRELENIQDNLNKTRDELIDCVQPLNELSEREVKQPEIEKILQQLDKIIDDLMNLERKVLPKGQALETLQKEVDELLDSQKIRKLEQAQEKLDLIGGKIADHERKKQACREKYDELRDLANNAKNKCREDELVQAKIKEYEMEMKQIDRDLTDCSKKIEDLKKKRADHQQAVNRFEKNYDSFTPPMVDDILSDLDDAIDTANKVGETLTQVEIKLDDMLIDIREMLDTSLQRQEYMRKIKMIFGDMYENLIKFKELSEKLPPQIEMMLESCKEMKIGSEPDDTADYWEERTKINNWTTDLKNQQQDLSKFLITYKNHQAAFDKVKMQLKGDLDHLKRLHDQVMATHEQIDNDLQDFFDCQDEVNRVKKEMGECELPVNIAVRKSELTTYQEKLERLGEEFADLKKADEDYKGDKNSEDTIKSLIKKIDNLLRQAQKDKQEHFKFQQNPLERYNQKDFLSLKNYVIIVEVREFKERIDASYERLKEIEKLMAQLNHELILQDMENATKILNKKIAKLRERLTTTKNLLNKIHKCGDEMDGNTTVNEEDEFIDALKDEMPEVFKNIELNFSQIDGLEFLLKEVIETQNIDKMKVLKKEVDDATNKVEQSESLSTKLENEIIEWNVVKKLCTRDEELIEIDTLLMDFDDDLKGELSEMENEMQKNKSKMEKEGDPNGELQHLRNGINSYVNDIDELLGEVHELKESRDQCFEEFDNDIPAPIKVERVNRLNHMGDQTSPRGLKLNKKIYMNTQSDKPVDMYYMITVNCRYKKRIHALLRELRNINQKRRELQDKYAPLKRDLNHVKATKMYKAVKGDKIDELFAFHLNKAQLSLPVKRVTAGKYMFGTRQILAKIINGKLVIRVGGGYMGADEFIEQYGKIELLKMMKADGQNVEKEMKDLKRAGSSGRGGAIGVGQMKAMMKNTLLSNIKTYTNDAGHDNVSQGRVTLTDLEANYDIVKTGLTSKANKSPGPTGSKGFEPLMNRNSSDPNLGFTNKLGSPKISRRTNNQL